MGQHRCRSLGCSDHSTLYPSGPGFLGRWFQELPVSRLSYCYSNPEKELVPYSSLPSPASAASFSLA